MIFKTRRAALVKVQGVFFFFLLPKRDYSTIPSTEEGNAEYEPERMFVGAAVIMSFALFWRCERKKREREKELKPVG